MSSVSSLSSNDSFYPMIPLEKVAAFHDYVERTKDRLIFCIEDDEKLGNQNIRKITEIVTLSFSTWCDNFYKEIKLNCPKKFEKIKEESIEKLFLSIYFYHDIKSENIIKTPLKNSISYFLQEMVPSAFLQKGASQLKKSILNKMESIKKSEEHEIEEFLFFLNREIEKGNVSDKLLEKIVSINSEENQLLFFKKLFKIPSLQKEIYERNQLIEFALLVASEKGHEELTCFLLEEGAITKVIQGKALHISLEKGHDSIAKILHKHQIYLPEDLLILLFHLISHEKHHLIDFFLEDPRHVSQKDLRKFWDHLLILFVRKDPEEASFPPEDQLTELLQKLIDSHLYSEDLLSEALSIANKRNHQKFVAILREERTKRLAKEEKETSSMVGSPLSCCRKRKAID